MDSLSLYCRFYENRKSDDSKKKFEHVDELIRLIYSEIFVPPFDIEYSSFISETIAMLDGNDRKGKKAPKGFSMIDVYVIITGLLRYIADKRYTTETYQGKFTGRLFIGAKFQEPQDMEKEAIRKCIGEIKKAVALAAGKAGEDQKGEAALEKPGERKLSNIRRWHEEQAKIRGELTKMQPTLSRLLEGFMTFSDKATESYVLQFARQQIELYDMISDNYEYHKKISEDSGEENYRNAVQNYGEFLDSISEGLAAFGIEEIISEPDAPFDGKIHETDSENFSARRAVVKQSLRAGFRYKDSVIQKEKVLV